VQVSLFPFFPENPMVRFRSFPVPRSLVLALLVAATAPLAAAQSVTLRGAVENVGPGFVMSCTPLTLVSGGANLGAVLGQEVVAVGTIIGPNTVSIATATPVTDVLEVNQGAKIGGALKFQVTGPAGRIEQVYVAVENGFATVHKMGWFLDTATQHLLVQATIPAAGKLEVSLAIPNLPVLANVELFLQDVRITAGAPFQLGNADCVTIQP
jgi:hypothetical protein